MEHTCWSMVMHASDVGRGWVNIKEGHVSPRGFSHGFYLDSKYLRMANIPRHFNIPNIKNHDTYLFLNKTLEE